MKQVMETSRERRVLTGCRAQFAGSVPHGTSGRLSFPRNGKGKEIFLFLERTKDSQVWVDNTWIGSDDSLSAPHVFDLSKKLSPRKHKLTILVDNAKLPPVGPCHQADERTQTNWNGILGKIELRVMDKVWLDNIHIFSQQEWVLLPGTETTEHCRALKVSGSIQNAARAAGSAKLSVKVNVPKGRGGQCVVSCRFDVKLRGKETELNLLVPVPLDMPEWDEFDRNMISVGVSLAVSSGKKKFKDRKSVMYGLRSFVGARGQFVINGRATFLRGKNDCAIFPVTGYAPMDKEYWLWHLGVAVEYGLNHF